MRISDILRTKGNTVSTIRPDSTVRQLLADLAQYNFGALIVSEDGTTIVGIVSERDVVRQLHERGAELLDASISEIMTADVRTCTPQEHVADLRSTMTDHRIRHVPVVDENGALVGLVSIGDVVKSSIAELETEREHLVGYIQS
jgi:CBS domain-containing protein